MAIKQFITNLKGLALFDKINPTPTNPKLDIICWERREIENYFARPELLISYAGLISHKFPKIGVSNLEKTMETVIKDLTIPLYLRDIDNDWWKNVKITDNWLDPVFSEFYSRIGIPQDFYKRDYYQLISLMDEKDVNDEIRVKLDLIYNVIK